MGSHSVTCHPTEVRIPPLHPADAGTRFCDPRGMQGWVDLCYVKATGWKLNPRPVNRKSNALPLSHHATQTVSQRPELPDPLPPSLSSSFTCFEKESLEKSKPGWENHTHTELSHSWPTNSRGNRETPLMLVLWHCGNISNQVICLF